MGRLLVLYPRHPLLMTVRYSEKKYIHFLVSFYVNIPVWTKPPHCSLLILKTEWLRYLPVLLLEQVLCSAWKDDGTTVFSSGCDKQVKMWPLLSGGQPVTVAMHDAPVKDMAWIPDMNLLATGSWDKTVR